jgi:hypothetical protein
MKRHRVQIAAIVPYVFPFSGVSIVGQVVIRSPYSATTSEGFLSGAVNGNFQLNGANPEATRGTTTQIKIRLSLADRQLEVRAQPPGSAWTNWTEIVWW